MSAASKESQIVEIGGQLGEQVEPHDVKRNWRRQNDVDGVGVDGAQRKSMAQRAHCVASRNESARAALVDDKRRTQSIRTTRPTSQTVSSMATQTAIWSHIECRIAAIKISRVHIDEAHNVYTAGLPHHGEDAFRPAYGKLGELRVFLPKGTPFQMLSATLPPHILSTIKEQLMISSDYLEIRLSTNRPNITYATIPLVGGLRNFQNLNLLLLREFHPPMAIPKTLIFHDCKQDATDAAAYLNTRLPLNIWNHEYLQQTFEDFSSPNGTCRILHATAGASVGLNIRGVLIVIQYGLCKNMAEAAQRAGRAVRDPGLHGLYLAMVEPWALGLTLAEDQQSASDPDRPYAGMVKKNASKQDRTSYASLRFAQSQTCLRKFFAEYLDDRSLEALSYTALWCCDRHGHNDFKLQTFVHGEPYTGNSQVPAPGTTAKRKRNQLRVAAERQQLLDTLKAWRKRTHDNDPYRGVWPIEQLIDNNGLELLTKTHPTVIMSPSDLTTLLQESEAWEGNYGTEIFAIIQQFDQDRQRQGKAQHPPSTSSSETRPVVKRVKGGITTPKIMYTFTPVQTPETFAAM
ncbi:P-loop containing nucleoside triphosphate hydrolase protein [Boletus edulis BED1]|uniref:DNA 3'-5' helicase n=1 Tax=Boletus edulis BED1 TaxID=1328754 RepID=A0AAD4C986_BOLED|nr:P-loop containing nucleoside triphosphate hydrolase protein [Boletus edulis BED1]